MKKKVDSRIRTLIENSVLTRNRSLFLVIGDKGKDQVVNLHYMLSKAQVKARPNVLWCYSKSLGFSSNRKKRMRQAKTDVFKGLKEKDAEDPFDLFLTCTKIRYCYYKESHKILGSTFGCLVLQDFEGLTPNLLARTVETVEGGGIVILLLKTISSLKQLYGMTMDVHSRYRTEAHMDVVPRFNERFLLSLGLCSSSLVVDDELNVLPISSHIRNITPLSKDTLKSSENTELETLCESLKDTANIGPLVRKALTIDQAKAILSFVEKIADKNLRSTVSLTAARGRGKSAALGLSIAGAVAFGYANIFVTAPSPHNLKTLFQMIFKGLDALDYKEHLDYEVVQSTADDIDQCVVRVNIFRDHRQTIQYIVPSDHLRLSQAELLVIDEAAAIPLTAVKKLLGPYLVFLSSTINGYEGTGRSLSLKLLQKLREENSMSSASSRALREITLEEPIRYAPNDAIEKWLNDLLCLDCTGKDHSISAGVPHPSQCSLYYVNRDTLFSYHKASESFLHRMMSLFVSSHYKNSPDDLQMLSDAPAHHLFVLLGPVQKNKTLPDILAAVQVCLEGEITKESVARSLSRGIRKSGDLMYVSQENSANA